MVKYKAATSLVVATVWIACASAQSPGESPGSHRQQERAISEGSAEASGNPAPSCNSEPCDRENLDQKAEATGSEEKLEPNLLMQGICYVCPHAFQTMEARGDKIYGWVQQGVLFNAQSPQDRVTWGTNLNWRSNDYRANQAPYLVWERPVDQDDFSMGWRVDLLAGTDAPFVAANGLFDHVTGFDAFTGFGFAPYFRDTYHYGFDLPQLYLDGHVPNCITEKGLDVRIGKWYSLMGFELTPAIQADFYTHSYEYFYALPLTHTGVLMTCHALDTLDVLFGLVRGWDVWEDNNNRISFTGSINYRTANGKTTWTTAWITGPEQTDNNGNYRTQVTSNVVSKLGATDQWRWAVAANYAVDNNAVVTMDNRRQDAEWYGCAAYLFYTVDSHWTLGSRAEWFRDDDAVRSFLFGRPGFDTDFFEVTLGLTYKPLQNVRLRPELRCDWAPGDEPRGARPFNDLNDKWQLTVACDLIVEF